MRCFTCGEVIGHKYEDYKRLLAEGKKPGEALNILGIKKYCCRRMFLSHVDLLDEQLAFLR